MKFVGGPWTDESRSGTFSRFFEAHAGLDRAKFLEKVRSPHLSIGFDLDPRMWDQAIVVRLDKKTGYADEVEVGRSMDADVTLNCPTMSKHHACFLREGDAWFVKDLKSVKGTVLDGQPIEAEKKTPLASPRPVIGFGPDVTATFLAPEQLFLLLEEARARRTAGPAPPMAPTRAVRAWPTWALLQDGVSKVSTQHELPLYQPPIEGAPKPRVEPVNRVRKNWRQQGRDMFRSPRKVGFTVVIVATAILCFRVYGKPLAIILFGESHPEWFRER
jgi:hypothetical protein